MAVHCIYSFYSLLTENMDDWDEEKLEQVVNKKHGEANKKKSNQTTIVSSCTTTPLLYLGEPSF